MATTLYLVFRNPGPSWVKGLPSRHQPLWDEHAVFMDRLFEEGRIVLAGPYADYSRVLLIVNARDADEASELFYDDPWAKSAILVHSDVIEWAVYLDSRRSGGRLGQMVIPDDPQRPVAVLRSASPQPGIFTPTWSPPGGSTRIGSRVAGRGIPASNVGAFLGIDIADYAQGRGSFASWRDSSRRPGPFFARSQPQHHTFFTQRKATPWYSLIHDETTGRNAEDGA